MKNFLFLFVLLMSLGAIAQPTATSSIIPEPGDSIHLIRSQTNNFLESSTGANQTWDFSSLSPDPGNAEFYFKFFNPEDTPHGDRYPTAQLAAMNPDSQFVYYIFDGQALQLIGAVGIVPGFGTVFADYLDNEFEQVFPVDFGVTWSDDFNGNNVFGVASAPFNGDISGEIDGFGTLVLPSGTFSNVLRVREERTFELPGADPMPSTSYRYLAADYSLWLLSIEIFTGPNPGPPLIFYADSPEILTAVSETILLKDIDLRPNPVSPGQQLFLRSGGHPFSEFTLFDPLGRRINSLKATQVGENFQIHFPANLSPGNYTLHGISEEGVFSEKILILK